MKQCTFVLIALSLICTTSLAHNKDEKKAPVLAVNFLLNDFTTAQRLENHSLAGVLKDKNWAQFSEMSYGLSVQYLQGITNHVDFSGTLGGSFVKYPFPNKPMASSDALLVELDAAVNLKLLTDKYTFVPYAVAGVGASMYMGSHFAAHIPVGMGFQINLGKQDAFLFTQGLYKMRVTSQSANHFSYSIGFAAPLN